MVTGKNEKFLSRWIRVFVTLLALILDILTVGSRSAYASTSKQWMHVGRSPLNGQQQQDVSRLSQNEKITAAWIIANASELIRFALYDSSTPIPAKSRNQWAKMLQDERFEKRVRKNLSPHFRSQLRMYDTYSRHTKLSLERAIQPQLERLGFYRGKIDG